MRIIFHVFILCLFSLTLTAQNKADVKFGKVDAEDLKMKYDSKDSSAEAIMLYDYEDIHFGQYDDGESKMVTDYHTRIKILRKSALDRGIVIIPYTLGKSGRNESIYNLEGNVYNIENGVVSTTKLDKESIFSENIRGNNYQKKITMPNVKEGSVIEYKFTRETPFSIRNEPRRWFFQGNIPFKWSELNITIPEYFYYKLIFGGYFPLFINTREETTVNFGEHFSNAMKYRLVMKDAPAFHNEQYITTSNDYVSKVDFELTSVIVPNQVRKHFAETWTNVYKTMMTYENFGERFKKPVYLHETIQSLSSIIDSTERVKAAFNFMVKTMKWNNYYGVYVTEDLEKIYENKTGSTADINLMLVLLLRELGFNSNPVVVSTRDHGQVNVEHPSLDKFNYLVTQVRLKGKDVLMDATEPLTKPGLLPERCLNTTGLLLGKDSCRLISLIPTEKWMELISVDATIDSTGRLEGTYTGSYNGYKAFSLRRQYNENNIASFNQSFKSNNPEWTIKHLQVSSETKPEEAFKLQFNFEESPATVAPSIMYLNPMLAGKLTSNPFKEKERIYPVDFIYPIDETYIASIKIPKGYVVEELPKPISLVLPDKAGKFTYIVEVADNTIKVKSKLSIMKTTFIPEQYSFLREFYNSILQKHEEKVILKRQ